MAKVGAKSVSDDSTTITELQIETNAAYVIISTTAANFDGVSIRSKILGTSRASSTLIETCPTNVIREWLCGTHAAIPRGLADTEKINGFNSFVVIPITKSGITFPFTSKIKYSIDLIGLAADKQYEITTMETADVYESIHDGEQDLFMIKSEAILEPKLEGNYDVLKHNQVMIPVDQIKEIEVYTAGRPSALKLTNLDLAMRSFMANDITDIVGDSVIRGFGEYYIWNVFGSQRVSLEKLEEANMTFYLI